jgi:iron complex outermembrane recepter protein
MSYKWALLAGASATLFSAPALAQTEDAGSTIALEEIVVTAQKREQNLQSVPVAVTAVTGEALQQQGITNFADLAQTSPTLTVSRSNQPTGSTVNIRGIGTLAFSTGVEPSVAVIVDDLPVLQQAQAFSNLSDVERVEVLRGPQGTLFGKNASAGAVNIVTRAPAREFGGTVSAQATSDEQYLGEGSVTGPLGERAAFRLTGYYNRTEGYIRNLATGSDLGAERNWGLRGRVTFDLTDKLTVDLLAGSTRSKTNGPTFTYLSVPAGAVVFGSPLTPAIAGITPGLGNNRAAVNIDPSNASRTNTFSVRATYDLGFASLVSITGFQTWKFNTREDADQTTLDAFGVRGGLLSLSTYDSDMVTQELRLVSTGEGPLQYVVGAFYSDGETSRDFFRTLNTPLAANWTSTAGSRSWALFGQATYDFTERAHLDVGLRYNNDRIDVSFRDLTAGNCLAACVGEAEDTRVTGKVALRYDLTETVMAYVSYATGYKGQGYDISSGFNAARARAPVAPEDSDAYEVGLKSRLFDNRIQLNIAAFRTDYDNFQAQSAIILPNGSAQFSLNNVGKLRTQGVEVEGIARVTEGLTLTASAAYLDAEIKSYPRASCWTGQTAAEGCVGGFQNLAGKSLPNAPKFRYNLSAVYDAPLPGMSLNGFVRADYRHQSKINFDLAQNPFTEQKAYGILDLSVGVHDQDDRWRLTGFVKNVGDEAYFAGGRPPNGAGRGLIVQILPRDFERQYGVRLNYNF